jgi:hypothetical protein
MESDPATAEAEALDDALNAYAQLDDDEEAAALLASPSRAPLARSTSLATRELQRIPERSRPRA